MVVQQFTLQELAKFKAADPDDVVSVRVGQTIELIEQYEQLSREYARVSADCGIACNGVPKRGGNGHQVGPALIYCRNVTTQVLRCRSTCREISTEEVSYFYQQLADLWGVPTTNSRAVRPMHRKLSVP